MTTALREAMTSGVFVEVRDAFGNTVGQAVYAPWKGWPLPRSGDTMTCAVTSIVSGRRSKIRGRVRSRHFELQHDTDGRPSVWVRLVLEQSRPRHLTPRRAAANFSAN